jgi:hypothetical protein
MSQRVKRIVRTALQAIFGIASALPGLLSATGTDTLPYAVQAAAVSTALAYVMGLPIVEQLLDRVGLGLVDNDGGGGA